MDVGGTDISVDLTDLPEALDIATYSHEKHALIVDNKLAQASRFLRYQRGCYLQFANIDDKSPENLRKNLVGALK